MSMIVHRSVYRCKVPTSQAVAYLKELFPGARIMRPTTGVNCPNTKVVVEWEAESLAALERANFEKLWGRIKPDLDFWVKWRSILEAEEVEILSVQ
jgi:hypothetical protein